MNSRILSAARRMFALSMAGGIPLLAAPLASVPRYESPGAGQVFYFLLTDRFANGSTANDTGGYGSDPSASGYDPTKVSHYHGGDFVGLTSKLDYIQKLGATAIWVTPPFVNKPMQSGTAGYHGYWILDFLRIDPHLGTDAEFRTFVREAHARGIKVFLDIVVNHTADVISYKDGGTAYVDREHFPFRDADGRAFNEADYAYNGVRAVSFPALSPVSSFPHIPIVSPSEAHEKNPDWLNDVTHYHNRGNSTFKGESSTEGDFVGLDDLFTEQETVVTGFIQIYTHWLTDYGIDGYRIDTVKHVNREFWQAFASALHETALARCKPGFFMFGEVSNPDGDAQLMSAFCDTGTLDASLDFGFFGATRAFVSQRKPASVLYDLFAKDDLYLGPDRNAYGLPIFISNHDAGRFGTFLKRDNPEASLNELLALERFANGLLFLCRGQPVAYYGDEQGMTGYGDDMGAREDMFASQSEPFRSLPLLGTQRTGKDDKFDPDHPLYHLESALARLREDAHAISNGAMILRRVVDPDIFAFSRIDRDDQIEYLVAFNCSRTAAKTVSIPTSQAPGGSFTAIFDSEAPDPEMPEHIPSSGTVVVQLKPLSYRVWRADHRLSPMTAPPTIALSSPAPGSILSITERNIDGQRLANRAELRADLSGGDGVAEVTFTMERASRPHTIELLGTSDRPPYRMYWSPPADLTAGDTLTFIATVDDLRGHRSSAEASGIGVAPSGVPFGIAGATVPQFTSVPATVTSLASGNLLALAVSVKGTAPLHYQWYHNGRPIDGATAATWSARAGPSAEGTYFVRVSNREGTALSPESHVHVDTTPRSPSDG